MDWMIESLRTWGVCWGLPGLEARLDVQFSERLSASLGRCLLPSGRVRLHTALAQAPRELLAEALCHEAAHAAVHELHGSRCLPHGPEWAALMRQAGYEPKVRLRFDALPPRTSRQPRAARLFVHVCPICQMRRTARQPVRSWRCAACLELGLEGRLEIVARPPGPGRQ